MTEEDGTSERISQVGSINPEEVGEGEGDDELDIEPPSDKGAALLELERKTRSNHLKMAAKIQAIQRKGFVEDVEEAPMASLETGHVDTEAGKLHYLFVVRREPFDLDNKEKFGLMGDP